MAPIYRIEGQRTKDTRRIRREIHRLIMKDMSCNTSFSHKKLNEGMMESTWVKKFYQDDFGASAVEYGILLAWIALVIVSTVAIFGGAVNGLFVKGNEIF